MSDSTTGGSAQLADNIAIFARILRRAGVAVGPSRVVDAVRAVEASGVDRRDDFFWALHSVLVTKREHMVIFQAAFDLFWRRRECPGVVRQGAATNDISRAPPIPAAAARRLAQAMMQPKPAVSPQLQLDVDIDATATMSRDEVLAAKDFSQMSVEELAEARRAVAAMVLPVSAVRTRRFQASHSGTRLNMRRMMRSSLATGGELVSPVYLKRREIAPPIVALCDISGSMGQYSRLFLHFLHALGEHHRRLHSFVFGTRLTNISRALIHRDPDEALQASGSLVADWSGGTRIATALHDFNRRWSRRVLGQGAIVLLMTDGLERDADADLAFEMQRLQKSSRRLIWLNPLLRYDGFTARASGVRTMLPFVDEFRPVHSLNAVSDLCRCLSQHPIRAEAGPDR
jgi:uncharacterized protein with von Willebrand factor type A (vWA) domain